MFLGDEAKERDGHTCQKCGRGKRTASLQAHHIHPSWAGGEDSLENLVTLCSHCHRFAPEREEKDVARRKTEAYLSTSLRPEFDIFLYGAVYGAREFSNEGDVDFAELADELTDTVSDLRGDEDSWGVDAAPVLYDILHWCYKLSADRDERANASYGEIQT